MNPIKVAYSWKSKRLGPVLLLKFPAKGVDMIRCPLVHEYRFTLFFHRGQEAGEVLVMARVISAGGEGAGRTGGRQAHGLHGGGGSERQRPQIGDRIVLIERLAVGQAEGRPLGS